MSRISPAETNPGSHPDAARRHGRKCTWLFQKPAVRDRPEQSSTSAFAGTETSSFVPTAAITPSLPITTTFEPALPGPERSWPPPAPARAPRAQALPRGRTTGRQGRGGSRRRPHAPGALAAVSRDRQTMVVPARARLPARRRDLPHLREEICGILALAWTAVRRD